MLSLNINDFSARYYDPAIGRFYSIDPLFNPATSPYAYCDNDPVNKTDPTGMTPKNNNYTDGQPTGKQLANNGRKYSGYRMDIMAYFSSLTHQPNYFDCAWDPCLKGEPLGWRGIAAAV